MYRSVREVLRQAGSLAIIWLRTLVQSWCQNIHWWQRSWDLLLGVEWGCIWRRKIMRRNSSGLIWVSAWLLVPLSEMGRSGEGQDSIIHSAMAIFLSKSNFFFGNFIHIQNTLWLSSLHSPPSVTPGYPSTCHPSCHLLYFIFLVFHFVQLVLPYMHEYRAICWSIDNLPRVTTWKRNVPSLPESINWPLAMTC